MMMALSRSSHWAITFVDIPPMAKPKTTSHIVLPTDGRALCVWGEAAALQSNDLGRVYGHKIGYILRHSNYMIHA